MNDVPVKVPLKVHLRLGLMFLAVIGLCSVAYLLLGWFGVGLLIGLGGYVIFFA